MMYRLNAREPLLVVALTLATGCAEQKPLGTAVNSVAEADSGAVATTPPAAESNAKATAEDDIWRGLERHEIQLDQKLLVVKGSRGVIGCGYLNIAAFEKFGEVCAIVPAVDLRGMPDAKVTAVTTKAKDLGIEVGMSGREALARIR